MSVTQELVYETSLGDVSSQPQALGAEPIEKSSQLQLQEPLLCITGNVLLSQVFAPALKLTVTVAVMFEVVVFEPLGLTLILLFDVSTETAK